MAKTIQAVFLLDASGSMNAEKTQVISGFNEYLEALKERKDKVKFTLTVFNSDSIAHRYISKGIKKVEELTDDTYQPTSLTPLYDAIAWTILNAENSVEKDDIVLFTIQTDGYENYSKDYGPEKIKDLIEKKKKDGWEFVFLGADQDALLSGARMGIQNTISYRSYETLSTFSNLTNTTKTYLDGKQADAKTSWTNSVANSKK